MINNTYSLLQQIINQNATQTNILQVNLTNEQTRNQDLQTQINQVYQEFNNQQNQFDNLYQRVVQAEQKAAELEDQNNASRDQLSAELRNTYRSQRRNRNPQWRDSESTLFGDENDQAGSSGTKDSRITPVNSLSSN